MANTAHLEHSTHLLEGILLLLVLSVMSVTAFRTLRLTPILGYLLVGMIAGPYFLDWMRVTQNPAIDFMGEVGVVFLLFAIGLEFSVNQLMAMRRAVLGLGGLQVLLFMAGGWLLLVHFGMSWQGAIIASGALAMSSTAIVVKQLTDQGEMRAQHGQLALAILLFQDIAVVPLLVIMPLLAGNNTANTSLSTWLLDASTVAAIFAVMVMVGHYTLRPLFQYIARAESTELFNLTILLVALTFAWVTQSIGLSLALGAFIAGMLLSETEYKHHIESEIRPFRDILMGIFFITVGAKLNLKVIPDLWQPILWLVLSLTVGKTLLIAALTRLFVPSNGVAMRTGLVLAQGGEFGFALMALALSNKLITSMEAQAVLAAIVISMAISPLIIRYNDKITKLLFGDSYLKQQRRDAHAFGLAVQAVDDHVILCGYRRMGQNIGHFLQEQGIPYIALELDPKIVNEAWEAGDNVYYADATRPEILGAAGLYRARLIVITVADVEIAKRIVEAARKKRGSIPILVRTRDDTHMQELEELGATDVLPETLEATVMIVERLLGRLGLSPDEMFRMVEKVRADGYQTLRSYFHGDKPKPSPKKGESFLQTYSIRESDYAVGKTIEELHLDRVQVNIKALRRGEIRGEHPAASMRLEALDILILEGKADHFKEVEQLLRHGTELKTKKSPS
ncbi:MAG: cation:proton antiporter [Candidatus Thiocaldithrix dubininis]|uniref:Cation:proton antiporter n=1 Tax=Candidatus Thiocaldithrix dubininis TaxID=3080823 RepID=A0AA95KJ14_9GAMM|nr:MAG: cation:proton antiporter [Candidatus Thiocaldithrix dubininis]